MTLLEFKHTLHTELQELYDKNEIDSFFKLLIAYQLDLSSVDIALNPNLDITQHDLDFLLNALVDLKQENPIQYVLGETEFYGLPFRVTKDTLIPRPETEELVDWILKDSTFTTKDSKLNILDIGTGSGCIAISLAKNLPQATVYALDISPKALKIAQQNAELNNVVINFIEHDILSQNNTHNAMQHLTFDIVVSNPPYVRHLEKKEINNNVLQHEPHQALFVANDDPLIFYHKIANFAKEKLSKNGHLFFEINQYLSAETQQLLQKKNYTAVELKKDVFDNYRMLKALL
jgi:release factor glutamine methyltransferase